MEIEEMVLCKWKEDREEKQLVSSCSGGMSIS